MDLNDYTKQARLNVDKPDVKKVRTDKRMFTVRVHNT